MVVAKLRGRSASWGISGPRDKAAPRKQSPDFGNDDGELVFPPSGSPQARWGSRSTSEMTVEPADSAARGDTRRRGRWRRRIVLPSLPASLESSACRLHGLVASWAELGLHQLRARKGGTNAQTGMRQGCGRQRLSGTRSER